MFSALFTCLLSHLATRCPGSSKGSPKIAFGGNPNPGHHAGAHTTRVNHEAHATRNQQGTRPAHVRPTAWGGVCSGRLGQCVEKQGTWAPCTWKCSDAGCGRPEDGGVWTVKTVRRPPQQPAQRQYANYWAPLTCKRRILPHPAQPQHTNHWALRTLKRHLQEHQPQRPTESSNPTQHAKGRISDYPRPRKETTTRRNVTQRGGMGAVPRRGGGWENRPPCFMFIWGEDCWCRKNFWRENFFVSPCVSILQIPKHFDPDLTSGRILADGSLC